MVKGEGWGFIKKFYLSKVQQFATNLLLQEDKQITEFEAERRELIGLRKLLGQIESDIKTIEYDRQKVKPVTKK